MIKYFILTIIVTIYIYLVFILEGKSFIKTFNNLIIISILLACGGLLIHLITTKKDKKIRKALETLIHECENTEFCIGCPIQLSCYQLFVKFGKAERIFKNLDKSKIEGDTNE